MKIGFAQINPTVGDLSGNFESSTVAIYERLAAAGHDGSHGLAWNHRSE